MPRNLYYILVAIVFSQLALNCAKKTAAPIGEITSPTEFKKGIYRLEPSSNLDSAILTISGEDMDLDFEGVIYDARSSGVDPSDYSGIAVRVINSRNVTIRNLKAHGFKIALYAENTQSLKVVDCDFSYNYRPRLRSKWDRESLTDWLYYHQNDNDEWLEYGGAVYLKDCDRATISGVTVTQGFNGILMVNCEEGLVYNNVIRFNSGLGIGMYRSSYNRIMHNRLDWNVRGYSHGKYDRGQDSAGILLYEQCNHNTIAFNSATHCGDGLFIWAGQQTMDSGMGGCNGNMIYRNDFSHSVANGIEATFSSNVMAWNQLNDCRYGVWAGYSHHSLIINNEILDCDYGIAIEHGNNNSIIDNTLGRSPLAIKLWERTSQPTGWGFAEKRNISSRQYFISGNTMHNIETAFDITSTDSILVYNNSFEEVIDSLISNSSNTNVSRTGVDRYAELAFPDPLHDGMSTRLEDQFPRGRQYMLVNEWGPYNFSYPEMFLRTRNTEQKSEEYTFAMFGPAANWKLLGAKGFVEANPKSGSFPGTLLTKRPLDSAELRLALSYHGPGFITQLGDTIERGEDYQLTFASFEPDMDWQITHYNYKDDMTPEELLERIPRIIQEEKGQTYSRKSLQGRWWGSPIDNIDGDRFITIATSSKTFEKANYQISIESDDGVRLLVDGKVIFEEWNIHTPQVNEVTITLNGRHTLEVVHFDDGGLAVLDLDITKKG